MVEDGDAVSHLLTVVDESANVLRLAAVVDTRTRHQSDVTCKDTWFSICEKNIIGLRKPTALSEF